MRAGFLSHKRDNFACLHTRQAQNELHLKRWFFCHDFQSKVAIFPSIVQAYTQPHSFDRRKDKTYYLDQNLHQTVTRLKCAGFSINAWRVSVPQMWQFCLFTYPPRSKWASSEKMIFFLLKSASSISRSVAIFLSIVRAYTQLDSFGGKIKLIICQIRHELSVTIHEISTNWKKVRWRTLYFFYFVYLVFMHFVFGRWIFLFHKMYLRCNQALNFTFSFHFSIIF